MYVISSKAVSVGADKTEYKLTQYLLANYDSAVRPSVNASEALNVTFGLALTQIIDVVSLLYGGACRARHMDGREFGRWLAWHKTYIIAIWKADPLVCWLISHRASTTFHPTSLMSYKTSPASPSPLVQRPTQSSLPHSTSPTIYQTSLI